MDTLISFGEQFFWAVTGALLGIWIPMLYFRVEQFRHPQLLGKWKSTYQGIDETPGSWVSEEIEISVAFGKLKLKNLQSSHGYDYTAFAKLVKTFYLVGDWESIRPGANAHGAFILTVSSQGNIMYGYWIGPDRLGARRFGRWVLGRDENLVKDGQKLIETMRVPNADI